MSPEPLLTWRSWPFGERPWASLLLSLFLIFLAAFLWKVAVVQWQMPYFYFLGMLLILGNLLPYFIPTTYELFEYEIVVHYSLVKITRKYPDFGCFYADKRGIMLSTFKLPRWLDRFRGQSLRFSRDQAEKPELIELLKRKVGKQY